MDSIVSRNSAGSSGGIKMRRVALVLAASLAACGAQAAEKVERDDTASKSTDASSKPAKESQGDLDARMQEAQKRLERAATEVAALSTEIAGQVMESISTSFPDSPRRSVIGVQLEPGGSGDGAKVQDVSPGGPAEQAGIRAGDVIVAVNGKEVKGHASREVVRLLRDVAPDSKVKLSVLREGKPKDFEVVARAFEPGKFAYRMPPGMPLAPDFEPFEGHFGPFNYTYGSRSEIEGLELTALTPQLGRYFGTDKGVLVVRAPQSEIFKLQDGDVILSIDGRTPTSGSHITRILRSYQPGEKLVLRVMRDRKPLDLEITLPQDSQNRRTRATRLDPPAQTL